MPGCWVMTDVRAGYGASSVIDIHGELCAFAEHSLMDAYANAVEAGSSVIILNFADTHAMDRDGVGLVATLLSQANEQDRRLLAVGMSACCQATFKVMRLDQIMSIYASEAEALATLQAAA